MKNFTCCVSCAKTFQSRQGSVLIIVLWITSGLVSIALLFGYAMTLEYRASDNSLAGMQAAQAVESAVRYATYIITNAEEQGKLPDIDEYETEWVAMGESTFWFIGRSVGESMNDALVSGLVCESSKLNLNTATQEMLEALPYMTTELAAAIIDWRDEDEDVSENGAESEAYLMRSPAFECKNAPFETVEELNLLIGADWNILYGEDSNRNGILDANEDDGAESLPEDNRDGRLDCGILEYLTIYSSEPNTDSDGEERININGEDSQELIELLQEELGEDAANEVQQKLGGGQTEYKSILEFFVQSGMEKEDFVLIADRITVSEEVRKGLVNVNTAPEEVLACIPGIGTDNASSLVVYRQSNSENLDSIAWVSEVLEEADAIEAGEYLTINSYQFTADVAAVGHDGKGFQRSVFIIDASGEEPVIRYRKDMNRLGWALGEQVYREIALAKDNQK
jgi:type II secretory pathway component PulK